MTPSPPSTGPLIPPWQPAPSAVDVSQGDVHVWRLNLDTQPASPVLSPDEREKADRFCFERDRSRYVTCRSILRRILALYTHTAPELLAFSYNEHGKPFLPDTPIRFNVSHSHGLALIVVTADFEIGIDVERTDPSADHEAIARRYFTSAEQKFIRQLSPADRPAAFYQVWTRKEAWMKALGHGLMVPPEEFDVSTALGRGIGILRLPDSRRSVIELPVNPGYTAALVCSYAPHTVSLFEWRFDPTAGGT